MNEIYKYINGISNLIKYIIVLFGLPILIGSLILRILFLILHKGTIKNSLIFTIISFIVGIIVCMFIPFLKNILIEMYEGLRILINL